MAIKIDTSKIKLPELSALQHELISKAMGIPKDKILERTKGSLWHIPDPLPYPSIKIYGTKPLRWEFNHDEECQDCKPTRKSFITELFGALESEGYHADTIERCRVALLHPRGFDALVKLMRSPFNYEDFVQTMIKVYKEINQGED